MRKAFLINIASSCLLLFISASAQGAYTYTTLDVPEASETYAYGVGSGDGEFIWPYNVALSDTGQVYVADRYNDRIQRFDADGNYETQWGSVGSGDGEFNSPYGVALSDTGHVYEHQYRFARGTVGGDNPSPPWPSADGGAESNFLSVHCCWPVGHGLPPPKNWTNFRSGTQPTTG